MRPGRDVRENEEPWIFPEVQGNVRLLVVHVQPYTPHPVLLDGIQ